jgi:hypothetical protein
MPRRLAVAGVVLLCAGALAAVVVAVLERGGGEEERATAPPAGPPAAPTTTQPPAAPPEDPPGTDVGVSVERLFNERAYSPARIDEHLAALRATGVTLVRSDVLWEVAEPEPPDADGVRRYDWSFADGVAGALARHGLRWLAIVDYAAPWAASVPGNTHSPPREAADYAAFARAFAQRYGRGGAFWALNPELPATPVITYEIWNEPDLSIFWAPEPDPGRYMDLYVAARDAIKAVDAGARVLIGGLSYAPGFIPRLFAARPGVKAVDGVAIHPYADTPLAVLRDVLRSRQALAAAGLPDVPLYVTEVGWATSPRGSDKYAAPRRRARYIEETVDALTRVDCGVEVAILYTWVSPMEDRSDEADWLGIRRPDVRPTIASRAFARAVEGAGEGPPIRLCGET